MIELTTKETVSTFLSTARVQWTREAERINVDDALFAAVDTATMSWSWRVRRRIVAIVGVQAECLIGGRAYIWLVTTPGLFETDAFLFIRQSRLAIERLNRTFEEVVGLVAADNEKSIRWLHWLRFRIGPIETHNGVHLRRFSSRGV